jgi:excisionase family DNA binding protein
MVVGMDKLLYNVNEVAGLLNISRAMVYVLINEGHIKTVHIGRSMRIHIDEVRAYVDSLVEISRAANKPPVAPVPQ